MSKTDPLQGTLGEAGGYAVVLKHGDLYTYLMALGDNSGSTEPVDVGRINRDQVPEEAEPGVVLEMDDWSVSKRPGGSGGGWRVLEKNLVELKKDLSWYAEEGEDEQTSRLAEEALEHLQRPVEFERKGRAVAEEYMEMVSDKGESDCSTVPGIADKHNLSVRQTYRELDKRVPDSVRMRKEEDDGDE